MQKIKSPIRINKPKNLKSKVFSFSKQINLPRDFFIPPADILDLIDQRHSKIPSLNPSIEELSTLLWLSQRQLYQDQTNPDLVLLPYPSAGSLGCVHTLLLNAKFDAWIYNRKNHMASILNIHRHSTERILSRARNDFNIGDSVLMIFFAERKLIENYYKNPESLVLREAGVLLGFMSLLAPALRLNFCPLGTLATDWLEELEIDSMESLIPAGACVVGR